MNLIVKCYHFYFNGTFELGLGPFKKLFFKHALESITGVHQNNKAMALHSLKYASASCFQLRQLKRVTITKKYELLVHKTHI